MFEILALGILVLFATGGVSQVQGEDLLVPAVAFTLVAVPLVLLLCLERKKLFESWRALTRKRFISVLVLTPLALLLIPTLGFAVVSSLLMSFYVLLLGERRVVALMLLLLIWNAVIYGVFVEVLHVPVPQGELFGGGGA